MKNKYYKLTKKGAKELGQRLIALDHILYKILEVAKPQEKSLV